jgi:hypothetical protein
MQDGGLEENKFQSWIIMWLGTFKNHPIVKKMLQKWLNALPIPSLNDQESICGENWSNNRVAMHMQLQKEECTFIGIQNEYFIERSSLKKTPIHSTPRYDRGWQ